MNKEKSLEIKKSSAIVTLRQNKCSLFYGTEMNRQTIQYAYIQVHGFNQLQHHRVLEIMLLIEMRWGEVTMAK